MAEPRDLLQGLGPSALLVVGALLVTGIATAQDSNSAALQAVPSIYGAKCASCHGASLQGGGAPPLTGPAFAAKWKDTGASGLAAYIAAAMPPGAAKPMATVTARQLADYILASGGEGAGDASNDRAMAAVPVVEDETSRDAKRHLQAIAAGLTPVTDSMLQAPARNDWLAWRGSASALGFSQLDQIDRSNVGRLRLVWSKTLGKGTNGIAPLAHDGVIFLYGGGYVSAIDAASGDTIWKYQAKLPPRGVSQPRGIALYGDAVYVSRVDNHVMALDAKTGRLLWDKAVEGDGTFTAAPLVARGTVFQSSAVCFGKGMRCFMAALDAKSGDMKWEFHTVPGDGEPGSQTWGGAPASERGGGGAWLGPSYDYQRDQLVFGTGNSYAVDTILSRDPKKPLPALYTNTTLKLDARTGTPVWYYQHIPGDVWDEDWAFEHMIVENPRKAGQPIVMTMGKLGILDALDLGTGKYLWSYDFGLQDIVTKIDPQTGTKTLDSSKIPVSGKPVNACPFAAGVRNWPATSYDPQDALLFIPVLDTCMEVTIDDSRIEQSTWRVVPRPGSGNRFGRIAAVDLRTGKKIWDISRRAPPASAVLATAGGLVFEGSRDRWFRALDSGSGNILWQVRLSDTPNSFPITFASGGRQYVAVVTGGGTYHDNLIPQLTPEIEPSVGDPALWLFALDGPEPAAKEH